MQPSNAALRPESTIRLVLNWRYRGLTQTRSQAEKEAFAALDALVDENQRLREALTLIAGDEYAGSLSHTIAVAALTEEKP